MRLSKRWLFAVLASALGVVLVSSPASASGGPVVTPVATGLDSPRGIAFFDGKLYVGEAGHGGSTCVDIGAPFQLCLGDSSQISWVNPATGAHGPFVSHLLSASLGPEGTLGVSGLSAADDQLLAQIGGTAREIPPTFALGQKEAGQLISVRANGSWHSVAAVGNVDFDYTTRFTEPNPSCGQCPGTQEHDANPYGVLATEEGALVADAGSNTLDYVNEDGHVQIRLHDPFRAPNPTRATFPTDAVPTCVARGKDSLWVGELSGRLLKVHGDHFTVVDNPLLSHVTGCTSDGKGNIYFVNMFGSGAAFTPPPTSNFFIGNVVKFDTETGKSTTLTNLPFPNMDTVGPDGNLYVTIYSICPTTVQPLAMACGGHSGGVVKITLPHGDND